MPSFYDCNPQKNTVKQKIFWHPSKLHILQIRTSTRKPTSTMFSSDRPCFLSVTDAIGVLLLLLHFA